VAVAGGGDAQPADANNESTPSTDAQAQTDEGTSQDSTVPATDDKIVSQPGGVQGGHFDLDTSITTYPFNAGTTARHIHQYDDKFQVTGVDYFGLLDPGMVTPTSVINPQQAFKIVVGNAQLSPGTRLEINGKTYLATDWQRKGFGADNPTFSLGGLAGTQKLTTFSVFFDAKRPISDQLIPTETELVRSNAPGPGGAYRAGAVTLQLLDAGAAQFDSTLGLAKIGSSGMLWESTLFWHKEKP
jgi:hypothetical protein